MIMSDRKISICHVCGTDSKLTDEHAPSKASGNLGRIASVDYEDILRTNTIRLKRITHQNGLHFTSLCNKCNNELQSHYNNDFAKFCQSGEAVRKQRVQLIAPMINIYPLRIIKQIYMMFCAITWHDWIETVPNLREYILQPFCTNFQSPHKIFLYYLNGSIGRRFCGVIFHESNIKPHFILEFAFPPFGYVLTDRDFDPDHRFKEVTNFMSYGYNDQSEFDLSMNAFFNSSHRPLDFGEGNYRYGFVLGSGNSMHLKID